MASPRRVGAETSATRTALLDGAERLMATDGYAAVTYRNVAASAEVTAGLVQYYFPKLDDLFVAMLERRSQENIDRFLAALDARPGEVLPVVWEFATDDWAATLTAEFMALANHRKAIGGRIFAVTTKIREAQLAALEAAWPDVAPQGWPGSPSALLFAMHAVAKMARLEESVGLTMGHEELLSLVERHLGIEPAEPKRRPRRTSV